MTKTARSQSSGPAFPSSTASSSYHMSESLDWSSLSAQVKNRTVLVPAHLKIMPSLKIHETKRVDLPPTDK